MNKHDWKDDSKCLGFDTNLFFDKYEEELTIRPAIDRMCSRCPVRKVCFAFGISSKETGVWGGVYLENGEISTEFNAHKDKNSWSRTWESLTLENE